MEQKDSAERILKQIPYEIVYSARKTLAVQVKADGSVVVRAPKRMTKYKIEAFLKEKQDWIHTHREKALAAAEQKAANRLTEAERKAAVKRAAQMLAEKTARFAKEMGVTYGRITIREQKTRWGSCSSAGNLKAGADAGARDGLRRYPRAGAPERDEPFRAVLRGGGTADARLQSVAELAEGAWKRVLKKRGKTNDTDRRKNIYHQCNGSRYRRRARFK